MQTLKELGRNELKSKLVDLRREQFALRAKKSTGSLEKPASLRLLRKQIARVLTLLGNQNQKVQQGKNKKIGKAKGGK